MRWLSRQQHLQPMRAGRLAYEQRTKAMRTCALHDELESAGCLTEAQHVQIDGLRGDHLDQLRRQRREHLCSVCEA